MRIVKHFAGLFQSIRGLLGIEATFRARKEGLRELFEQQSRMLDMIAKGMKPRLILQELAGLAERLCGAGCAVYVPDGEDGENKLRLIAASGLPREYIRRVQGLELGPSMGASASAANTRRIVAVPDTGQDARCEYYRDLLLEHPQLRSCWAAPILAPDGSVEAVFELHYTRYIPPSADTLALLDMAGRLLNLAIEGQQMREELHRCRYYDEVTGLPNRSFFRERLQQAMWQDMESSRSFAILYLEISGLETLHTRFGQVAEDDCLKQIADQLYDVLPPAAVLCRLGENRFAALVWEMSEAETMMLGRRLTAAFEIRPFQLDPTCRVSAAVGIGMYPKQGQGVLQAAKADLYRAKAPQH
jgi:diguanylate cyclase (GGDEF)-like protein